MRLSSVLSPWSEADLNQQVDIYLALSSLCRTSRAAIANVGFSQVLFPYGITASGLFASHLKKHRDMQHRSIIASVQEGQNEEGVVVVGATDAVPM